MSSTPTPCKPSPLSFNSPRQSPFRRPSSIREASPAALRPSTPTSSPLKVIDTPGTPSQANLRQSTASNPAQNPPSWLNARSSATPEVPTLSARNTVSPTRHVETPVQSTLPAVNAASVAAKLKSGRDDTPPRFSLHNTVPLQQPTLTQRPTEGPEIRAAPRARPAVIDAMSKISPPLLHSMRESFSLMDHDNDGHINSTDVTDMLSQLALSAGPSQVSSYFNGAQSINLATYLNTLSDLLVGLSHPSELSAAFEAFDDGDDGQIDVGELKDALLRTAPEPGEKRLTEREIDMVMEGFSARRAFGKGTKSLGRGEVFRYQDFMASLTGSGGDDGRAAASV